MYAFMYTLLEGIKMHVNVRDARRNFAAILDAAAAGDDVVIDRYDQSFELRLRRNPKPSHLPSLGWLRERGKPDQLTAAERLSDERER
jgi:hypothetical protein